MKTAPIQDFSGENIYVGFDVHKKSWKVTILTDYVYNKSFSQEPSVEKLINYLHANFAGGTYHSAYEAGFCGFGLHRELSRMGVNSIVVNPADIPTTHKEQVQKEDKRDSNKIAKGLRSGDLKGIYVPSINTVEDRGLLRMRHNLVKDTARSKNRIKSFLYFHGIPIPPSFDTPQSHWSRRFMEWLKTIEMTTLSGKQALNLLINQVELMRAQILEATRQIRVLSRSECYQKNMELITGIPGIGLITGMTLLTELDDIRRFENSDKLCSFMGLVPTMKSSGEREKHGHITHRSNQLLRMMIIESSWIAVRHDPTLTLAYQTYCKKMEPNKAIIRIARKLITRIQVVLRDQVAYKK
jgi:transposase